MDKRKNEKAISLILSVILIAIYLIPIEQQGIKIGSNITERILYPFFHANIIHLSINIWSFLCIMFIYQLPLKRLIIAYIIVVSFPIDTIAMALPYKDIATIGLSGFVFALMGSISFEVLHKKKFQISMIISIALGFAVTNINGYIHLYCYIMGVVVAILNKPFKRKVR